jgi:hypothetical protein
MDFMIESALFFVFLMIGDAADGKETPPPRSSMYDTSKTKRVFGFKYRTIAESTKDTMDDFKARGW